MGVAFNVVHAEHYKDGREEKTRYTKIGVVIEGEKGYSLKLNFVPTGWDGWAYLMEPKEDDNRQQGRQRSRSNGGGRQSRQFNDNGGDHQQSRNGRGGGRSSQQTFDDMEDDIPF